MNESEREKDINEASLREKFSGLEKSDSKKSFASFIGDVKMMNFSPSKSLSVAIELGKFRVCILGFK